MNINLEKNNVLKTVKLGFSWTFFFFGIFIPLFRGDLKWFLIILISTIFTYGLALFVFMFVYNKIYVKDLLEKGYKPADKFSEKALKTRNIIK
jgi:hypothetical protein